MKLIAIQDWQKWLWTYAPIDHSTARPEFRKPSYRSRYGNADNVYYATASLVSALIHADCPLLLFGAGLGNA